MSATYTTTHGNAGYLTHCAGLGIELTLPQKPELWQLDSFFFFFCLFAFSRAAPAAYGGSQARGLIGAVAAGLRQSYSNTGSEPRLRPTPQLTATPDP